MPRKPTKARKEPAKASHKKGSKPFCRRNVFEEERAQAKVDEFAPRTRNELRLELRNIKDMTKESLMRVLNMIVMGERGQLEEIAEDPEATVLESMVAACAKRAWQRGDMRTLDALLDRMVGKVTTKVDVEGSGLLPRVIINMPSNGREAS